MIDSRRTYLDISYNQTNITADLAEHLRNWTFTDNLSGEVDDLQIDLEDVENKWLGEWFPVKGSLLEAIIVKEHWKDQIIKTKIGKFQIDEIEASEDPASHVTIKALSVPESNSLRGEEKSKAWEKTTLKVVAGDIASRNGLKLYYESSENPKKDRYEQEEETDLEFLYRLCKEEGLCLKLSNTSIVILDEADYEAKPAVATINRISKEDDEIQVEKWSARTKFIDVYKAARVQFHDSTKKTTIITTFTPPKAPKVGRTLVIKEQVKSVAEGQRLAKKKLREKNKDTTTVNLTVTTTKHLDAGMTINLKGFGKFDEKYIITQAIHSQESVELALRLCLEGY